MSLLFRLQARYMRGVRISAANRLRERLGWERAPHSDLMRQLRRMFGNYIETQACGRPFIVDLRDTVIGPAILYYKVWEPEKTELFARLLRTGDRIVDVGANIGYFSVLFAAAVGPTGKVVAIEPDRDNCKLLAANLRINGLAGIVQIVRAAAGASEGEHFIEVKAGVANRGDHRTFSSGEPNGKRVRIPMVTVDDCTSGWASVRLIKMDIQGFEYFALQGMRQTLQRNHDVALVTEFWPSEMRRAGSDPDMFLAELGALGFSAWRFALSSGLTRTDVAGLVADLEPQGQSADLVFMRDDAARSSLAGLAI